MANPTMSTNAVMKRMKRRAMAAGKLTRSGTPGKLDRSMPPLTRRGFLAATASLLAAPPLSWSRLAASRPARPVPTPAQLAWQRDELALFLHFGVNTFTDREWGDGREDPTMFNPTALDARQWARAAREAGARALILTAKHHDGFCLWPSRVT